MASGKVAPTGRADMITTVMSEASGSTVRLEAHDRVHARMDLWQLGKAQLFRSESSGMRMRMDERQTRRDGPPLVALVVQERSVGFHAQFDDPRVVPAGELMVVDLTAAFDFSWRTAPPPRSRCPSPSSACRWTRATDRQTLLAQIREYVRQNIIRDPDLSAAGIARAHHVSVRHLYSLREQAEFSFEQWIIGVVSRAGSRTRRARTPRTGPLPPPPCVGGSRDPAHFTRRFRTAYGLTPRDWRSVAHEERPGGGTR